MQYPEHLFRFFLKNSISLFAKHKFICYSPAASHKWASFPGSSVVEPPAVNRLVAGSNPARGAIFLLPVYKLLFYREIFKSEIVGRDAKIKNRCSFPEVLWLLLVLIFPVIIALFTSGHRRTWFILKAVCFRHVYGQHNMRRQLRNRLFTLNVLSIWFARHFLKP